MVDNVSMKKFLLLLGFMFFVCAPACHAERIGVLSDNILTESTPYNSYFKTPDFLVQDIIDELSKTGRVQPIQYSQFKTMLQKSTLSDRQIAKLKEIQHGYDVDFLLLKKIAQATEVDKLLIVTSGIDVQRDFLKPTLWSSLNVPGFDTVNPTQRVTVYAVFVDCKAERVLWEELYSKNIRNNKMKNLDVTVAHNYEGMMRLKTYSKFVAPEISYAVANKVDNSFIRMPRDNGLEELVMKTNRKIRLGSVKNLSNPNYINDSFDAYDAKYAAVKQNVKNAGSEFVQNVADKKDRFVENASEKKVTWIQKRANKKAEKEAEKEALKNAVSSGAQTQQESGFRLLNFTIKKESKTPTATEWFVF